MADYTGVPGYPYKPRKKKSCRLCLARSGAECTLEYAIVDNKPAEICPKPQGRQELEYHMDILHPELRVPIDIASLVEHTKRVTGL